MALDVKVKIDLNKPIGSLSFGFPLILTIGEAKTYTECSSLEAVKTAGFEETTATYKAAQLMFRQNDVPAKVAVCGLAEATELDTILNKEWRQLVLVGTDESQTNAKALATAIEATSNKMLFVTVADETAAGTVKTSGSDRTVIMVSSDPLAAAALAGESAGLTVGSFTYKNLILNGIEPEVLTDEEIEAIHTAGAITFVTKAGDNVTTEGKTASGEYIDIIDCQDYIISNLEYQTQKTLNQMPKIPYDNNGIAVLESTAVNVMKDCYNKGMIATNEDGTPAYTVDYALREDTSQDDRVARKYLGGQFSFKLAGAIHTVEITGEIEI